MNVYLSIVFALVPAGAVLWLLSRQMKQKLASINLELQELRRKLGEHERELADRERDYQKLNTRCNEAMGRLKELKQKTGAGLKETVRRIDDNAKEIDQVATRVSRIPLVVPGESGAAAPSISSPLVTEVMELLDQGISPEEIARQKGIQVGEIDLIRGLTYYATRKDAQA